MLSRFSAFKEYGSFGGADFKAAVTGAAKAIHKGVFPERIRQGSSGSYFVLNSKGVRFFCFFFGPIFSRSVMVFVFGVLFDKIRIVK